MERMTKWYMGAVFTALGAFLAEPAWAAQADAAPVAAQQGVPPAASPLIADTDRVGLGERQLRRRHASTHPNELSRIYGKEAALKGDWHDAMRHFREAARYGDKYSQHRVSLMYWYGAGVAVDRALAYVWADLAAERMYPELVLLREKMWMELTPEEQARALDEGPALYDEYGDAVAKRNFARALSRAKRDITGSRTGFVGKLESLDRGGRRAPLTNAPDLDDLYDSARWDPQRYWAMQDAVWKGRAEVGELEVLPREAPRKDGKPAR